MRNIRRALRITFLVVLALFLHYVLPQQDVARIVGTEIIRTDLSGVNRIFYAQADAGGQQLDTRDLRLINTVRKRTYLLGFVRGGDQTMVYRNEDTGWIYPPYFKFDSSDLQAEANDMTSTSANPEWVVITHYGWRIRWLTVFPNAISIREAPGPDYRPIPWVNLLVLAGLVALGFFLRAMWAQFRERTLDPIADAAGDRIDRAQAGAQERRGRFRRWLDSWKS
ncbi:DUF1523 family protein [Histidinibacterium lentulum]|uniref:DUF1523 family protein n=1 Tax=Histidinibacterium lentulum TaxID=2480588 RepID=A0A3N2R133_9RHOB|nr:DUF1523 family protein [Histidinibacterium lentulum]ROU01038.1 DUF1523 family protein [Histidinibacterium lentulum]